ncbi:LacI family DNA-binding transcriptional regulator [Geminisphaera colitermitum]|uniref:LacI family DNA-binding transcriptional regulator n=1 Tax=Geminisphaera colitermitum TaxID=1148786 RepID=UPI000316F71D|nr:LacI family DNA-binding transcriptional regulator [Geminisphaera colitermitum]
MTPHAATLNKLNMEKRITIREIAARAGLHYSSVSLALRDDPRLPVATRKKIKTLAAKMGYIPDAALSALAAYRNSRRPHPVHSELAYLTDRDDPDDTFANITYQYARNQATLLGYNLQKYLLTGGTPDLRRLQSIWWNRGVRGIMIGPFLNPDPLTEVTWEKWPVVAYGHSVPEPAFNRAVLDHFQNTLSHLNVLRSKGYSRIGFCLLPSIERHTAGRIHAAWLYDHYALHPTDSIPTPLVLNHDLENPDVLEKWIRSNHIDIIVAYLEQYDILTARGWRFPRDIGFSLLTRKSYHAEPHVQFSGFNTKAEVLAANTIHFLVSLIHEQACGILDTPRHYMISGEFHEGETLRKTPRKTK